MSADYWRSTQRERWKFTAEQLSKLHQEVSHNDLKSGIDDPCQAWDDHIRIYIYNLVQTLGQRLGCRRRVLSTAHVYLMRIFTKISIHEMNIFLLVTTAVYVAGKTEEQPQHIRTISNEARVLWTDYMPSEATLIAECEFYMIEELHGCLIVHHPYRSLSFLCESMADTHPWLVLSNEEFQGIWAVINDSYASDIPLMYAPHIIATSALYMTLVLRPQLIRPPRPPDKIKARIDVLASYLGKSAIDLEKIAECVQELVSLYARWETYDQRQTHLRVLKTLSLEKP
ncbi:RNA polymerase II holoenzyme cyclin-like subunit [Wickerhamiella sorbophila]|uniref:RNA polymerase II holoenzyme cyclin-like subunit n=1 Tax=Wickerhamiella sorbophila TaxID=45607 RepID=A0A2T0FH55_9ASCO|nr:RNA polymerase II holoenzyme cyclin-like subunit [Wickerhamiella sorbophila]PRT54269.1 RNA polymerase II holoenzyme cyclin-like subunit [Wickerhamiella sorbophila]